MKELIEMYSSMLADQGQAAISANLDNPINFTEKTARREALDHVKFMLHEMHANFDRFDEEKRNRWLGFVQGVLWREGLYSIDELRQQVIASSINSAPRPWICFHCGFETINEAEGRAHFGDDSDEPESLCQTWADLNADGRAQEYQSVWRELKAERDENQIMALS
jgi:hypothetical protein